MTPNRLLAHFHRITEAPDAVPRLRRFILSLALQGKLVRQEPSDQPASELLALINKRRRKLLECDYPNADEARTQRKKQEAQKLPTGLRALPQGWAWATLMQCSLLIVDCHNKTAPYSNSGIILLRTTNVRDGTLNLNDPRFVDEATYARWSTRCEPTSGDILITREAPMGEVCRIPEGMKVCLGQRMMLARLVPDTVDSQFLLYSLRDPQLMDRVQDKPVGATVQHLRVGGVETLLVPLPPLAEQHRIVAKVDELMALCDRLEAAKAERENRRDRLVAGSLHRLNNGADADAFREHARFHLRNLPRLTTRPEHIHQLRQTILNLAVRGKLVPQDPGGEPASNLLNRLRAEKDRLIKEGSIKKEKPLEPVLEDDAPFEIPQSWIWVRIGTCSILTEYGTSEKSNHMEGGIPVLKMGDIQNGKVLLGGQKKVPQEIDDLPQLFLKKFDLLYNRTNSAELVGKTGIYLGEDDTYTFASYLIRIRLSKTLMSAAFVNLAMNAPYFRATQIVPELQQQCGQANVNGTKLRKMVIPLPPLPEQHRIVAKVEELMALCDQIEAQLTTSQTESRRLLEAVLHDALGGATH